MPPISMHTIPVLRDAHLQYAQPTQPGNIQLLACMQLQHRIAAQEQQQHGAAHRPLVLQQQAACASSMLLLPLLLLRLVGMWC